MSSSDVEIKPCQVEFLPQLSELWKEYMIDQDEEDPLLQYLDLDIGTEGFQRIIKSYMEKEPGGLLVATLENVVVGFAVSFGDVFGPNYVTKKRVGQLQIVHTKRGFRRRGIATKLIEASLEYLKGMGCSIILAETGENNVESIKMLEKFGFKERGKLLNFMIET